MPRRIKQGSRYEGKPRNKQAKKKVHYPYEINAQISVDGCANVKIQTDGIGRDYIALSDGQQYEITVSQDSTEDDDVISKKRRKKVKRKQVAVVITIDGESATPVAKLFKGSRTIKGFETERHVKEAKDAEKPGHYDIVSITRPFTVCKENNSETETSVKNQIGIIRIDFYGVKLVSRRNKYARSYFHEVKDKGEAPLGLLKTVGGSTKVKTHTHLHMGRKKPIADMTRLLGSRVIHIRDADYYSTGLYKNNPFSLLLADE